MTAATMPLDPMRCLAHSGSNFLFTWNGEGDVCSWSPNAEQEFLLCSDDGARAGWRSLVHPIDLDRFLCDCTDVLRNPARQLCTECRFRLRDSSYAWVQCGGVVVEGDEGSSLLEILVTKLLVRNNVDSVTNLRYIESFRAHLADICCHGAPQGIILLGIDGFRRINDLYSYSFGDRVLANFAERLEKALPKDAQLYRLDGDSFGIVHPLRHDGESVELFESAQNLARQPILIDDVALTLTVSGGMCRYPDAGTDGDELYRNARIAFAEAKGSDMRMAIWSPLLATRAQRRMRLLEALKGSVRNGCEGFSLLYQPIVNGEDETLRGCEALMRWTHPDLGNVQPLEFIPILEDSGLIFEVNEWLLHTALEQCARWFRMKPGFRMSINFPSSQYENPAFRLQVVRARAEAGVPASAITLELTESGEVHDYDTVNGAFGFLRSQGVRIALDDFGIGYSSLSVFQLLSADELKIDRSFLQRLTYDVTDQILVQQLVELCHSMNMIVCAEGVEGARTADMMREFGTELLQGFLYGRPLSAEEFEERFMKDARKGAALAEAPSPEREHSMVYAPLHPVQPMDMSTVVDSAHAGIFQVAMDADFTFITCNEGYRRMLGYTAREMETRFGNHALGIVHPDDAAWVNEEIRRQLGEGDTVTIEFRVVRWDGTPIWILGTGNVVKGPHGEASLVVVIVDNDRFKSAQLEVARRFSRYERVLDNVPNGIKCVRYDEDFTIDYISPGFLALTGFTLDEVMGRFEGKYINLIYEKDRRTVMNDILEQLEVSDVVTMRYRSPCKDGSLLWVDTVSRLCPPEEDGIQRAYSSVVAVAPDLAAEFEQGRDERQSLAIANRLQAATEQWGDVVFEIRLASNTISYSDNYDEFFGRTPSDRVEDEVAVVYPADRHLLNEALDELRRGCQPDPLEVRGCVEGSGYRWLSIEFAQVGKIGDDPVSAIGRLSDITDEKLKQERLFEQSRIDGLTNLLNKRSIEEDVRASLAQDAKEGSEHALVIVDVDDFKNINDSLGHLVGDQVLSQTALRFRGLLGDGAAVGRAGGDELMAYVELGAAFPDGDTLGARIVDVLGEPVDCGGTAVSMSVSVGIALHPRDAVEFYDLFCCADSALYLAKAQGKAGYAVTGSA